MFASTGPGAVRPFRVDAPQSKLDDLGRRIEATVWPDEETVTDHSQGIPLGMIQKLARHWATDYDWRACDHVDKGGHFAAWEQPQLFSEELRAAFRSVR
jgi:hypothetical protein